MPNIGYYLLTTSFLTVRLIFSLNDHPTVRLMQTLILGYAECLDFERLRKQVVVLLTSGYIKFVSISAYISTN